MTFLFGLLVEPSTGQSDTRKAPVPSGQMWLGCCARDMLQASVSSEQWNVFNVVPKMNILTRVVPTIGLHRPAVFSMSIIHSRLKTTKGKRQVLKQKKKKESKMTRQIRITV